MNNGGQALAGVIDQRQPVAVRVMANRIWHFFVFTACTSAEFSGNGSGYAFEIPFGRFIQCVNFTAKFCKNAFEYTAPTPLQQSIATLK